MVLLIVIFEMNWSMHFILSSRHRDDYVFVENFIDVRTSTSSVVYQNQGVYPWYFFRTSVAFWSCHLLS